MTNFVFNLYLRLYPSLLPLWSPQVDTYRGVLEHISMINRTVDYLKIDIEGSELGFFENILLEDPYQMQFVKQIAVEIHVGE